FRIDALHLRNLLFAVDDELGAEHLDVVVGGIAEILVAIRPLRGLAIGMEGIARAVRADEALPAGHEVDESLLALWRHGRIFVRALGAEIAGGVEEKRVELREVRRREKRSILGKGELPVVLRAEL